MRRTDGWKVEKMDADSEDAEPCIRDAGRAQGLAAAVAVELEPVVHAVEPEPAVELVVEPVGLLQAGQPC